jgi:hypothetical protein
MLSGDRMGEIDDSFVLVGHFFPRVILDISASGFEAAAACARILLQYQALSPPMLRLCSRFKL